MSSRERNLAILLIALILLFGSVAVGYAFVWSPIQSKEAAAATLDTEIRKKQEEFDRTKAELKKLEDLRRRSLPSDVSMAKREYAEVMTRLLVAAKVPTGYRVRELTTDPTGIPAIAPKKPAYTKLAYEITFERADMWNLQDFLLAYYRLPLLHQITMLDIKTDAQPSTTTRGKVLNDRRDLVVKIVTEAIILDGADNRKSLFSVPAAFAAVGGLPGVSALANTPEAIRHLFHGESPVLASRPRDYSLLVLNDIFHGPLPAMPPMSVERIADISVERDKEISPVKVRLAGDLGPTGKVSLEAKADGKILTGGSVKVDQLARTIAIVPMEGEIGSGEITVTAKNADGKEVRTKFKVKITEPEEAKVPEKTLPDISDAIKLIIAGTDSENTGRAVVKDNFNPFTYEIEATPSGRIKVTKFFFLAAVKKRDREYLPDEPSHLVLSDDGVSNTKRTFQVVAWDSQGMYVLDLKPKGAEKEKPKAPVGKGPVKPPAPEKQAIDPLALIVGEAVVQGQKAAPDQPVLYRWPIGQSLKAIKEVPKDDAKKILEKVKASGPVAAIEP
jgi:hypothetical protein